LSFFQLKKKLKTIRLAYDFESATVSIENKTEKSNVVFDIAKNKINHFEGLYNRQKIGVDIGRDRSKRPFEDIHIGNWEALHLMSHHRIEEGYWISKKDHKRHIMHTQIDIASTDRGEHFVYKNSRFGADRIWARYLMSARLPIPVGATGVILKTE